MKHLISTIKGIPSTLRTNSYFPPAQKFLTFLFAIDLFFIFLHFYSLSLPVTEDSTLRLRLDMDMGYAEIFQYFQFTATALLLIAFFIRQKKGIYLIWSLFFLVLFIDDAFAFHETFGANLVNYFDIKGAFGLRAQDLGELMMAAMLGATFVLPFMHSLFWGNRKSKEVTIHLILLTGLLVFFGVGMDMLHSFLKDMPGSGALTVIEDSGEMFAGSLMISYALCLHIRENRVAKDVVVSTLKVK